MLYPKIRFSRRKGWDFKWLSTKTGFRYGGNSLRRWARYPLTRFAWVQRSANRRLDST